MATSNKLLFSMLNKHAIASDNLDIMVSQTSARTKRDYHNRFYGMYNTRLQSSQQAGNTATVYSILDQMISEIEQKRHDGQLKHSSLRQYKATINYGLTYLAAAKDEEDKKRIPPAQAVFYQEVARSLRLDQINALSERVLTWGAEISSEARALDKRATVRNQTSSSKMKGLPLVIYNLLMSDKFAGRHYLREFIYFNVIFGLRPKEWQFATLYRKDEFLAAHADKAAVGERPIITDVALKIGTDHFDDEIMQSATDIKYQAMPYVMKVKNAKATHGRSCGEYRYIHFTASEQEFERLQDLMVYLHEKADASEVDLPKGVLETFELTVFKTMQSQLYKFLQGYEPKRLLKKIHDKQLTAYQAYVVKQTNSGCKVQISAPVFKRPTLYSTRHQAIANAKADGLTKLQIAALFGHVSTSTAGTHYASGHVGHAGSTRMAPDPENIEYILMSLIDEPVQAADRVHNKLHDANLDFDAVEAYENNADKPAVQPIQKEASPVADAGNTGSSNTSQAATKDQSKPSAAINLDRDDGSDYKPF